MVTAVTVGIAVVPFIAVAMILTAVCVATVLPPTSTAIVMLPASPAIRTIGLTPAIPAQTLFTTAIYTLFLVPLLLVRHGLRRYKQKRSGNG